MIAILVKARVVASAGLLTLLAGCGAGLPQAMLSRSFSPSPPTSSYAAAQAGNDLPPRLQWMANFGYCGEVSFISAGLYYGQYASQYEVRAIASPGIRQNRAGSQLLLGANDRYAAARMHLDAVEWPTSSGGSHAFLTWVRRNVALGRPVAIGVYTNERRFYGNENPNAGDSSYDHIVPVTAVRSAFPLASSRYHGSDVLTFSDNGLWDPTDRDPRYAFSYRFGSFTRTRRQANAAGAPVYSLASEGGNYGIAIAGVLDPTHETLPVRVATNVNDELPAMKNHAWKRPAPMPLVLTITVSGLRPGVTYRLYRYDSFASVPNERFNARAAAATQYWTLHPEKSASYTFSQRIMSDQVAVYRAVPASGP